MKNNSEMWDIVRFYIEGDHYLEAVLNKINSARLSIEFEVYIFDNSPVAKQVLDALSKAAQRGVRVRLMVDAFGSLSAIPEIEKFCADNRIEFRIYNKIPFQRGWLTLVNPLSVFFILTRLLRYNKRNHRKVIIIDGFSAFVGSFNITSVHFAKYVGPRAWQDLAVYVEGAAVSLLRRSFIIHWAGKKFFILPESPLIRVNSSFIQRYRHWRELLRRIGSAKERVWIMNAYFVPHKSLIVALKKAAKRGVDVRLILPAAIDVAIVKWATPSLYKGLLERGVKVFEFQKTILHTKTLIIDRWGVVGSHNLNYRSLIHDLESEVVLEQPQHVGQLDNFFREVIEKSKRVTILEYNTFGLFARLKARVALWVRYFM